MASARDIKRRIKSVKSTQQITKAMKMVSAAKLRKAQTAVTAVRPFTRKIDEMILHVGEAAAHPYLIGHPAAEEKRICYVIIGSDRGLCGGFNGNLNRFVSQVLAQEERDYCLITIGSRVREFCQRSRFECTSEYTELGDNPSFQAARVLSEELQHLYNSNAYDEIYLIYSYFRSAMSQTPQLKRLLPVPEPEVDEDEGNRFHEVDYIFEPDSASLLASLLPQYVDINVYCALQEAKASEHGARMTAMSSATDNATEMIDRLTLSLNRARQAAITTEITEIVGGAAALQ